MSGMYKNMRLSLDLLRKLARRHMGMLAVQVAAYCSLLCYDAVIGPMVISNVYTALEAENIGSLYRTCLLGGVLIAVFFTLCFLNNVFLDLNSFRISLTATQNACRMLTDLRYDTVNKKYTEGELQNRIDACTNSISGIFPLAASVLANCVSILALLCIAGRISGLLLAVTLVMTCFSYAVTLFSSGRRKRYEEKKQTVLGSAGDSLRNSIMNVSALVMYKKQKNIWRLYQQKRTELWKMKWKQELLGMLDSAFTDLFTSFLRGVLGWGLYDYYEKRKIGSGNVASAFSVFDKMRGIALNFSQPVSNVRNCLATVERFQELMDTGKKEESIKEAKSQSRDKEVISLENVSYDAGQRRVLRDVSFRVERGEKIAIIGSNGSGKSTLLRVILGLNTPDTGSVSVLDENPGNFSKEALHQCITYIPARNDLYGQSVRDNILMNCGSGGEASLTESCTLAGMSQEEIALILERNALQVSEGQMRRTNIARGIINRTPLLLADEPDSSVHASLRPVILKNLLGKADTVLVVTHHEEYLHMFTRILIVNNGTIVADGAPEKVMEMQEYAEWLGRMEEREEEAAEM